MTDIKIESGVPLANPNSRKMKYPLADMKVGDSFRFPTHKYASVNALIRRHSKETGKTFTLRKAESRCWRTA